MTTTLRTNQESAESGERQAPRSNARTTEAGRAQQEEVPTTTPVPTTVLETLASVPTNVFETPLLFADPAPAILSPSAVSRAPVNSKSRMSLPVPPLSEIARAYMESVRRQAAFTHTTRFQELLNQSQGITQASPQRSLFRHPALTFRTLHPAQGPPPPPQPLVLPMPRRAPPVLQPLRPVPSSAAEPLARWKMKLAPPIELEDLEDDSAKTTPPGSNERGESRNQSDSDPPLIPTHQEPVATRLIGRI